MSTFTALHSMVNGVVAGKGPTAADVAAAVVEAVYNKIRSTSPTNASQVGCNKPADVQHVSSTSWQVLLCCATK